MSDNSRLIDLIKQKQAREGGILVGGSNGGKIPKGYKSEKTPNSSGEFDVSDHPDVAPWLQFRASHPGMSIQEQAVLYRKEHPKKVKPKPDYKAIYAERKEKEKQGLVNKKSPKDLEILRLKREAKAKKMEAMMLEGKPVTEKNKKLVERTNKTKAKSISDLLKATKL